jgi:hypothetical protein
VNGGAGLLVRLATRVLPSAGVRRRYAAEFAAELHGRPVAAQLRWALGVLATALALRAALGPALPDREVAMLPRSRRSFVCRVLHWHRWRMTSNADGERYLACSRCGEPHLGVSSPLTPLMVGRAGGI